MRNIIRPCLTIFLLLGLLTGIVYPMAITALGQVIFPFQANGSLISRSGSPTQSQKTAAGSVLIAQNFSGPGYFWPRPSATSPPYDADNSGGSNLGPRNPALVKKVASAIARLQKADPGDKARIPVDLVTSSGSGLDPDISPAAAYYQVPRVARARHVSPASLRRLIRQSIEMPWLGFFGERYIDVLELNIRLNRLCRKLQKPSDHPLRK